MPHDVRKSVWDAIEACRLIREYTAGVTLESYQADTKTRAAVERYIEILGEALNRVKKTDSSLASIFPEMNDVIGMRNCIAHGYDDVDDTIVLRAAFKDVPPLMAKLEAWLEANA